MIYREFKGKGFSKMIFAGWIFRAVLHASIIFLVPVLSLRDTVVLDEGQTHGVWFVSTTVFFCVVLVPTFIITFEMMTFNASHILSVWFSIFSLYVFVYGFASVNTFNPNLYGVVQRQIMTPSFWLVLVLTTSIPLYLELIYRGLRRNLRPSIVDIVQERIYVWRNVLRTRSYPVLPDYSSAFHIDLTFGQSQAWISRKENNSSELFSKDLQAKLRGVLNQTQANRHQSNMHQEKELRGAVVRSLVRFKNHNQNGVDAQEIGDPEVEIEAMLTKAELERQKANRKKSNAPLFNAAATAASRPKSRG